MIFSIQLVWLIHRTDTVYHLCPWICCRWYWWEAGSTDPDQWSPGWAVWPRAGLMDSIPNPNMHVLCVWSWGEQYTSTPNVLLSVEYIY